MVAYQFGIWQNRQPHPLIIRQVCGAIKEMLRSRLIKFPSL